MTDLADRTADGEDNIIEDALADSAMGAALEEELGIQPGRFVVLLGLIAFLALVGGWQLLVIIGAVVGFIVIHELGHYLTARWSGMKVTEFFVGFGPRIFAVKRGETTYGLKTIPAGAYVRIIGMNNLDEVDPVDEPRAYRNAAWHKRMVTIAAGPLSHFVIALVLGFFLVWQAGQQMEGVWEVKQTIPFSAAEEAGLQESDRILSIEGRSTADFDSLNEIVREFQGQVVSMEVRRELDPALVDAESDADFDIVTLEARIGERLTALGSKGISGLYQNDMIVAFDGQPVANYAEFAALASERIGERVPVDVVYGAERHTELVTINSIAAGDDAVKGFLGVASGEVREPRSAVSAIGGSAEVVGSTTKFIVTEVPQRLATKTGVAALFGFSSAVDVQSDVVQNDPSQIRPISIDENRVISIIGAVQIARQLVDDGWPQAVGFLILLNISFGLLNALPMLPLDGGHMVIATYERIRSIGGTRYHADAAKLLPVTYAVVAIFMLIGGIAMLRDIFDPIDTSNL